MPLSGAELRDIAARAATLDERVAGLVVPAVAGDPSRVNERLARWGRALGTAPLGPADLAERAGRDVAPAALGPVRWPADRPLLAWVCELAALVEAVEAEPEGGLAGAAGAREAPFEHVLRPFVAVALRRLADRVPPACLAGLAPAAVADLARQLLDALCGLWAPTLALELAIARASERALAGGAPALAGDPRAAYRRFVTRLLHGGLPRFLREYAVLGRRTVAAIDAWLGATAELVERLHRDRPRLASVLAPAAAAAAVAAVVERITVGLSDPHDGGRAVAVVAFAGGGRVVYKPRSLAVDVAYAALLDWLAGRGLPLPLSAPRVVDCATHGWVEHVAPAACADGGAAARFYRRAGELLALYHVLGSVDCHHENIVARGEDPLLVDPETVMHPRVSPAAGAAGAAGLPPDHRGAGRTVLDVGMLPVWSVDSDGPAFDISGLGGGAEQETPFFDLAWDDVNTDAMVCRPRRVTVSAQANRPTIDGQVVPLAAYVDDVVDGFRAMAGLLVAERDAVMAADGPVAALARAGGRFVFRATSIYGLVLRRLHEPDHLREGIDASLALEALAANIAGPGAPAGAPLRPLLRAELAALERLDVPRFACAPQSTDLPLPDDTPLVGVFDASPLAAARDTLAALDAAAIERQVNLIRAALWSRAPVVPGPAAAAVPHAPLDAAGALAAAREVGASLLAHAVTEADGARTWIAFDLGSHPHRLALRPLDVGLYDGTAGVALCLAALARFGEVDAAADAAAGAVRATLRGVASRTGGGAGGALPADGQAFGLGGVLYTLVRCSDWLDRPAWLAEAARLAGSITPAHIAADRTFDVIGGVAGLIPGLLAVHRATGDPAHLARAADCGRHLLAHLARGGATTAGFSHGAAGIACQLARLGQVTSDGAFLDGARDAIVCEQTLFDAAAGNWRDLRADDAGAAGSSWCHGATGIALSRAVCLGAIAEPDVRPHIEAAVTATVRAGAGEIDCLCCGNAGRIDVLTSLAVRLDHPPLLDAARHIAGAALARSRALGAWRHVPHLPRGIFHPPLFQGAAGVCYALLRLAMPDRLPSVLMME